MLIQNHSAIPYKHWQPKLHALGGIVYDFDDIDQSIKTIVLTEKGSVPTNPEKCTRLATYVDRRPDYAIPNLTREIFDAVRAWEPRVEVSKVKITREDYAHYRFPVFWRVKGNILSEIHQTIVQLPSNWQATPPLYQA
jgi:uncharacterized protein